jgi:hypothetical protein
LAELIFRVLLDGHFHATIVGDGNGRCERFGCREAPRQIIRFGFHLLHEAE